MLPLLFINQKKQDKPLVSRDYVGWSIWAAGFLIEAIADYQKSSFRANPDNTVATHRSEYIKNFVADLL